MMDCAQDAHQVLPAVQQAGLAPAVVARYLGTGGGAATPITRDEADWLHGQGLAVLPVYNDSRLNGGAQGDYALGQHDAQEAAIQAQALGVPAGTYLCCDIEYGALDRLTGDYLAGWADAMRASSYGGAGMIYANLYDPRFGQALDDALVKSPSNVGRLGFWLASWLTSGDPAAPQPAWEAPHGPTGLPWQPQHVAQVWAWQYAGGALGDTADLSVIRLPLPAYGAQGLWLPDGTAGSPKTPSPAQPVDVAAALAQLRQIIAAAQAAEKTLRG